MIIIDCKFSLEVSFIKKAFTKYAIMIIMITKKQIQFKGFYSYCILSTDCKHVLPILPFYMQEQCTYIIYCLLLLHKGFIIALYKYGLYRTFIDMGAMYCISFIQLFNLATKRRRKVFVSSQFTHFYDVNILSIQCRIISCNQLKTFNAYLLHAEHNLQMKAAASFYFDFAARMFNV